MKKLTKKIQPEILHCALWTANIFGRLIGQSLNIPVVCDLHSNFEHDGKLRSLLENFFIKKEATYIAVSNTAKNGFFKAIVEKIKNKEHQKHLKGQTLLIRNGIDVENVIKKSQEHKITRQEIGLNDSDFVVGSVGRLDPIKSQDILIKGFTNFCIKSETFITPSTRNPKLCLIGDGLSRKSLEKLAKNLNIENKVLFLGQKNDACNFYPLFDCFVLSSKSEGLSIALLEALCFGLPIITTNSTAKHDVIVDQENGFLVPVGDVEKLSAAILKLYNSPELITKIRSVNTELIKTQFEINKTVQAYEELYYQLRKKFVP